MKYLATSLLCLGAFTPALMATSISFAGIETGDSVSNWSNTALAKALDLNGDDRFGGAGYYQITPGTVDGGIWTQSVPDGNDLGISALYGSRFSKPAFLSENPVGSEGIFYNISSFPLFYDPTGSFTDQQGALSVTIKNFVEPVIGEGEHGWNKAFSFILAEAASFRIGVAVDTVDSMERAPDNVSITNVDTGEVFSTALNRDGIPDMVFFDIEGAAGDEFAVNLWQTDTGINTSGPVAFSLVTFDEAPTPTLSCSQLGDNFILSWEQNIPGWILESSTDLGATDSWDPVPGVENNSVSVPMTGMPKNFFRLRKNP